MNRTKTYSFADILFRVGLLFILGGLPTGLLGQTGDNAIWVSHTGTAASTAFLDASLFSGDICGQINAALTSSAFVAGMVVDARGITPAGCTTNPFSTGSAPTKPSTVLLPAGTITLSTAWAIPTLTQVIGQGAGVTILKAVSSGFTDPFFVLSPTNPAVIHMGVPNTVAAPPLSGKIAFSVVVAHLTIDGNRQSLSGTEVDGIDNNNAEEQSYVDDVMIQNVLGNGLYLSNDPQGSGQGAADHSGPYTNLVVQQTTGNAISTTTCVTVTAGTQPAQPRGIRGITCLGDSTAAATTGFWLGGSNMTIEDVRIDGFINGITVESGGSQANLLLNITGTSTLKAVTNLVNIESASPAPVNLAAMGLSRATGTTCSILDQATGQTSGNCLTDQFVGMYLLGAPIGTGTANGYSRFTTTPNFPTWAQGKTTSSGISGSCTSNGSLFSSTTGSTTGGTLWLCLNTSGTLGWTKIK